jgi:Tfp pilus assembly protein FimT
MSANSRVRTSDERGYSLVEMLTTIVFLSTVAAVGLPHIDTRRQDINSVMSEVIGDLRFTRARSITSGTHYALEPMPGGYQIQRLVQEEGEWVEDSVAKTVTLPEHISIDWNDEGDGIEFNTRGFVISADSSFQVTVSDTLHGAAHVISVWPSGQIYYES